MLGFRRCFIFIFIYFRVCVCGVSGNLLWHAGEIQIRSDAAFWRSHHLPQQDRNAAYGSLHWFFSSNPFRLVPFFFTLSCFYSVFVDICASSLCTLSPVSRFLCFSINLCRNQTRREVCFTQYSLIGSELEY